MLLLLFLLRLLQNSTVVFAHLPFETKTLSTYIAPQQHTNWSWLVHRPCLVKFVQLCHRLPCGNHRQHAPCASCCLSWLVSFCASATLSCPSSKSERERQRERQTERERERERERGKAQTVPGLVKFIRLCHRLPCGNHWQHAPCASCYLSWLVSFCASATLSCQSGKSEREAARERERERERHTGRAQTSTTARQHTGTYSNTHMEYQYAAIVIPPPAAAEQHGRLCPPSIRNKDIVNLYSTTAAHKLVMASAQTVPGQVCLTLPPPTVRESSATCSMCIVLSILARVFLRRLRHFPAHQARARERGRQ